MGEDIASLAFGLTQSKLPRAGRCQAGIAESLDDPDEREHCSVATELSDPQIAQQHHGCDDGQ